MTLASSECLAQNCECAHWLFCVSFSVHFIAIMPFVLSFFRVVFLQQHSRGSEETKEAEEGRERGKVKSKWRISRCRIVFGSKKWGRTS